MNALTSFTQSTLDNVPLQAAWGFTPTPSKAQADQASHTIASTINEWRNRLTQAFSWAKKPEVSKTASIYKYKNLLQSPNSVDPTLSIYNTINAFESVIIKQKPTQFYVVNTESLEILPKLTYKLYSGSSVNEALKETIRSIVQSGIERWGDPFQDIAQSYRQYIELHKELESAVSYSISAGFEHNKKAIIEAHWFIDVLPNEMRFSPRIVVAATGEVNFLWKGETNWLDLSFRGKGTYTAIWQAVDHSSTESLRKMPTLERLDPDLSAWIKQVG